MNGRNEYPKQGWRYLVTAIFLGVALQQSTGTVQAQELLWAKQADGGGIGRGIAVDGAGNSYVTGQFSGSTIFGPGEAHGTTLVSSGFIDTFVAKYTPSGDLIWAKRVGGTGLVHGYGIVVDSLGQSYVTGSFSPSAIFGRGETHETTLITSSQGFDIFVAKYGPNGALVWAKRAGGTTTIGSTGIGIAVDSSGQSYVTGHLGISVTFGHGEAHETTLVAPGTFVAKYASSGNLVWAKQAGGGSAGGIAVDGLGQSYVTGSFRRSATFGLGEHHETTLVVAGNGAVDMFVAKYATNGNLVWAKRAGGESLLSTVIGNGIAVDSTGKSYVTGKFVRSGSSSAIFGPGELNETTLLAATNDNTFVAKFDSAGNLVWAKGAGGAAQAFAVDGLGQSYVIGHFGNSATFGPGEAHETTLVADRSIEMFVAKFGSDGSLLWAKRAGGGNSTYGRGVAVDSTGQSYVTGEFTGSATFGPGESNETTLVGAAGLFVAKFSGAGLSSQHQKSIDFNGDGKADILWRNTKSGVVAIWLMNGAAIESTGFPGGVPLNWQIAAIGDVNGDGRADVIWRHVTTGAVALWLMNGTTVTATGFPGGAPVAWALAGTGDLNGDGQSDLVWRHTNSGAVAVWLMNGTTILSSGFLGGVPATWQIAGIGDVNGDGKADVIWRNSTSGTVAVWVMNGLAITSVGFPGSTSTDWKIAGMGDVDGNGTADVIWRHTNSGAVVVWLLNGTTMAASGFFAGKFADWKIAQVGDVNGDGNADVVWRSSSTGELDVWLMNGLTITSTGSPGATSPDWEIQGVGASNPTGVPSIPPGIPTITGVYSGTATVTNTNCSDPTLNTNFTANTQVNIGTQNGNAFTGVSSVELFFDGDVFFGTDQITGTVSSTGDITGTIVGQFEGTTSSGTFSGYVRGNTLFYSFSEQDTSGETCHTTGTVTATK
jgi:VCBS repeat protein/beta-propeller repeat-containing protein